MDAMVAARHNPTAGALSRPACRGRQGETRSLDATARKLLTLLDADQAPTKQFSGQFGLARQGSRSHTIPDEI
jgi:hypothetical protein